MLAPCYSRNTFAKRSLRAYSLFHPLMSTTHLCTHSNPRTRMSTRTLKTDRKVSWTFCTRFSRRQSSTRLIVPTKRLWNVGNADDIPSLTKFYLRSMTMQSTRNPNDPYVPSSSMTCPRLPCTLPLNQTHLATCVCDIDISLAWVYPSLCLSKTSSTAFPDSCETIHSSSSSGKQTTKTPWRGSSSPLATCVPRSNS